MSTASDVIAIAVGAVAIAAALWRIGTGIIRFIRRFDRIMAEHETILKTIAAHGAAIEQLQRAMQRRTQNRG